MQTSNDKKVGAGGAERYKQALRRYHEELHENSKTDFSTAILLEELDELLDRCAELESPVRESVFVEEVCRMGRVFNLAA